MLSYTLELCEVNLVRKRYKLIAMDVAPNIHFSNLRWVYFTKCPITPGDQRISMQDIFFWCLQCELELWGTVFYRVSEAGRVWRFEVKAYDFEQV